MNDFRSSIDRIAEAGRGAYHASPHEDARAAAAALRGRVRRRRAARAGVGAGATLAVILALVLAVPRVVDRSEPAAPGPGDVAWTLDLGAEVWGEPLVVGDVVYVGATDGSVRAVRVRDGSVAWEWDAGAPVRAAITTDGLLLFVATDDNRVVALADRGVAVDVVWEASVGDRQTARGAYDTYGSAPAVLGGRIVVGSGDGTVRALDPATGDELWSHRTAGVVRSTAGGGATIVAIGSNDGSVYALDPASGEELWRYSLGNVVASSPAVAGDVVVVGSRGTAYVGLDAASGALLWSHELSPSWAESSPVPLGGLVVVGSSSAGTVTALDPATGEVAWETAVGGWPWARPTVGSGDVFVATAVIGGAAPGTGLVAIDGETGEVLWSARMGAALEWAPDGAAVGAMASPAIAPGLVIVAGLDGILYAFGR